MLSPTRFTGLEFFSVSFNLKEKCTFENLDSWMSVHINVCRSSPFFSAERSAAMTCKWTTGKTWNKDANVEQICMKRTSSSVSSGAAVFSCVGLHSCVQCPASMSCILPLPSPSLLPGEDKVCMHECCEYVWERDMRVWVQGLPSQTQQGAGGGGKRRPGSLPPSLPRNC